MSTHISNEKPEVSLAKTSTIGSSLQLTYLAFSPEWRLKYLPAATVDGVPVGTALGDTVGTTPMVGCPEMVGLELGAELGATVGTLEGARDGGNGVAISFVKSFTSVVLSTMMSHSRTR
jgi:hypothetical protein